MESNPSDADLVRRTLAGDREGFGALCDRYARMVGVLAFQKVGNVTDAEDVAQEAFLKAYAALGELADAARFGSWLYGIALRCSIDHHRRRERRGESGRLSLDAMQASGKEPAGRDEEAVDALVGAESAERVLAAVGELPDAYRVVLTLRYLQERSYKEIAAHLQEPPGTVANRLHRAVGLLRERLRSLVEGGPADRSEGR